MKNKNPIIGFILVGLLFLNGIGRDDVSLSKYYQFAKDPVFNCIGELYYKNKFQLTCILIDNKHILTVAHGFYHDSGQYRTDSVYEPAYSRFIYGQIAQKQKVGEPKDFYVKFSGKKYKLKNIHIHETYLKSKPYRDQFGIHPSEEENYDLAIAELITEVKEVQPAILNEDFQELNHRAILCGYGEVEKADEINTRLPFHKRRKMAGENMIDSLGGFKAGEHWAGLCLDFDAPNSNCCNRMGSSQPLPLEYYVSAGDCGSGLFIFSDNTWKLAGVHAGFEQRSEYFLYGDKYDKYYGFTGYYIRTSVFKDWIWKCLNKQ